MTTLEETLTAAIADGSIPGAVVMATNTSCSFQYARSFGFRSVKEETEPKKPLQPDDIMAVFSCTKLVTTIAALQLVERGVLELDTIMENVLPELSDLKILVEITDDGTPVLNDIKEKITLGQLLTHSAGMGYYFIHPAINEYHKYVLTPKTSRSLRTIPERFGSPLLYEPGTSWEYSCSMDWVGLAVARISKTDLETYCQTHIFGPLGITDFTFWLDRNPHLKNRLVDMTVRDDRTPKGLRSIGGLSLLDAYETEEELGGQGLYGSVPSFLKILHSILADDEKLLLRKTTAMMFEPQLTNASRSNLQAMCRLPEDDPKKSMFVAAIPPAETYDWGLGGLLTTGDFWVDNQEWRRKGCLIWGGVPNLCWFIDRRAGICGIYGGQMLPPGDRRVKVLITKFEQTMYRLSAQSRENLAGKL